MTTTQNRTPAGDGPSYRMRQHQAAARHAACGGERTCLTISGITLITTPQACLTNLHADLARFAFLLAEHEDEDEDGEQLFTDEPRCLTLNFQPDS